MFNLVLSPKGCVIETSQTWLDGYLQPSDIELMGKKQQAQSSLPL